MVVRYHIISRLNYSEGFAVHWSAAELGVLTCVKHVQLAAQIDADCGHVGHINLRYIFVPLIDQTIDQTRFSHC